jgi:hypothetical protein
MTAITLSEITPSFYKKCSIGDFNAFIFKNISIIQFDALYYYSITILDNIVNDLRHLLFSKNLSYIDNTIDVFKNTKFYKLNDETVKELKTGLLMLLENNCYNNYNVTILKAIELLLCCLPNMFTKYKFKQFIFFAFYYVKNDWLKYKEIQQIIFPWEFFCAKKIEKFLPNISFKKLIHNEKLIQFASVIMEDQNLNKNIEFLIKDYINASLS